MPDIFKSALASPSYIPVKVFLWLKKVEWQQLMQEKSKVLEKETISPQDWLSNYDWLRDQAVKRLKGFRGNYLWIGRKVSSAWPDPLKDCSPDEVVVNFDLPEEDVLLFSSSAWDMVIMGEGLSEKKYPLKSHKEIEKSWENIFDLERLEREGEWDVSQIKCAFEIIKYEQVTEVKNSYGDVIYRRGTSTTG